MDLHRAIERMRAMPFGPESWEQLMLVLSRTTDIHSKDAVRHYEATHSDDATDEHALCTIEQHNVGVGEEEWAPDPALNDRSQKSWGLNHNSGNARFGRDQITERYNYGTVRSATATGTSVEDDPSYVPVEDDDLDTGEFNVFMQKYTRYALGDTVMYVLKKDGTPWTFGGGDGQLRKATATADWQDGTPPTVECEDAETGETITVDLPRTMAAGDPNVRDGATLYYQVANDGRNICCTDYMDDKRGTIKQFYQDADEPYGSNTGWDHHTPSAGRFVPNYLAGDPDFPTTGTTGGTKDHDHDPHTLSMVSAEIVTGVSFDSENCLLSGTTCQICFVGQSLC